MNALQEVVNYEVIVTKEVGAKLEYVLSNVSPELLYKMHCSKMFDKDDEWKGNLSELNNLTVYDMYLIVENGYVVQ